MQGDPAGERRPSGLGRRRPRRSDEETARLMLDAALAMVNRTGLTVSLEHIGFEDVIQAAGVSRSAVYRRWPYKDLFFSDLLKELARAAAPAAAVGEHTAHQALGGVLESYRDRLGTPEGRHDLVGELIRRGTAADLEAVYASTEWRTYLALHATFISLPEGALRDEVQAALAGAECGFRERIARSWEGIATALGYRLRVDAGGDFDTLATLVTASLRGLVTMALSEPGLVTRRVQGNPAGTSETAQWSLAGIATASIAMTFLEPDPGFEWDERQWASLPDLLTGRSERTEE